MVNNVTLLETYRKKRDAGLIKIPCSCLGDERITFVYSVKPELKEAVTALVKELREPIQLTNFLCTQGILEAEDILV